MKHKRKKVLGKSIDGFDAVITEHPEVRVGSFEHYQLFCQYIGIPKDFLPEAWQKTLWDSLNKQISVMKKDA